QQADEEDLLLGVHTILPLTAVWAGAARVLQVAVGDKAGVDVDRAVRQHRTAHGVHRARRRAEHADTSARIRGTVAWAAEPPDDAREVHGRAIKAGRPRHAAPEVRTLPVEGQQAARAAHAEHV